MATVCVCSLPVSEWQSLVAQSQVTQEKVFQVINCTESWHQAHPTHLGWTNRVCYLYTVSSDHVRRQMFWAATDEGGLRGLNNGFNITITVCHLECIQCVALGCTHKSYTIACVRNEKREKEVQTTLPHLHTPGLLLCKAGVNGEIVRKLRKLSDIGKVC